MSTVDPVELTTDEWRLLLLGLKHLRRFFDEAEDTLGSNVHMARAALAGLSFKVDQAFLGAQKAAQEKKLSEEAGEKKKD